MLKLLTMGTTGLLGMAPGALFQGPPPPEDGPPPPPPHDAKKKGGPEADLTKAYDLLRRLRAEDAPGGKPEERLRDLTERATKLYRRAVEARDEPKASHEYGAAAHDLARAVDHARKASLIGRPDPELPPPPPGHGPEEPRERTRRDLRHAYDRIRDLRDADDLGPETKFYYDTARDLYTAARRDAEADRFERAGELARAAEAITHVPEHLARAQDHGPGRRKDDAKKERDKARKDREKAAKEKRDRPDRDRDKDDIPPPID